MESDNLPQFTFASLGIQFSYQLRDLLISYRSEVMGKRGGYQLFGDIGEVEVLVSSITAAHEYSYALGAFDGEKLVGVAWARLVKNGYSELCCDLEVLVVLEHYRAKGIGDFLFTSTRLWAKELSAVSLDMVVLPGDRNTKNFCERHGLLARSLQMYQAL